ncbi:hypothetical protein RN001_008090 [Aquatica leii]|uniref:DDE Tnp4 domain-containing protein n=1 Tax=Aquatica leii TaxID=1421715 RepID=A0AAN7SH48_9COLE|nr:hypothetical protein RN001_008090 [Aquatica leii]
MCESSSSTDDDFEMELEEGAAAVVIINTKQRICWVHIVNKLREKYVFCVAYLATGNSFRSIGFSFRIGFNTVQNIVQEVCEAIWEILSPIVMPNPTEQFWKKVSQRFEHIWNFPNCSGAIDGKHINIRFHRLHVGFYGRNSDGNVFAKSTLGKLLENKKLNVPADTPLTENERNLPYTIVGDEAFLLKTYLLRPYSRNSIGGNEENKIFNYILSRTRRVVENSFGILIARWRVSTRYFEVQPTMVDSIVLACCCLHNMLYSNEDVPPDTTSYNKVNSGLTDIGGSRRNVTQRSFYVREKF